MEENKFNTFLVIEDDPQSLESLVDLIRKNFLDAVVYSASDGNSGWNQIERLHPNIIISEMTIPGLSGTQICKRLRNTPELEDAFFLAIVPILDKVKRIKFIEDGADDFINKPYPAEDMLAKLSVAGRVSSLKRQIIERDKLLMELAEEIENDINDMVMLSISFQKQRMPSAPSVLKEVSTASYFIARYLLNEEALENSDIKLASLLAFTGRLFLSDELIDAPVMNDGIVVNNIMARVPIEARDTYINTRRLKNIGSILYHIYENYDGSGIPERLKSWQIPFASRIIRVVLDYYELRNQTGQTPMQIINNMHNQAKRLYDHRVVILLEQYLALTKAWHSTMNEKAVKLHDLRDGVIITRDIITNNGLKLVSKGTKLDPDKIKKIISHNMSDPIIGSVFIETR